MFSPLRRSSPGPGIHHRTWALRATSPPPSHAPAADNTTPATSRPPLKRQATAPAPSSSTVLTKKKRESVLDSEDDQVTWSDNIHSAFLEALQKHPPIATWNVENSSVDDTTDEQAEYYKIIQDYILKKTGKPHSLEQILEHISLAIPSPIGSPLIKTPPSGSSSSLAARIVELNSTHHNLCDIVQRNGRAASKAQAGPIGSIQTSTTGMRPSESASMSRRRKACNRPALDLHVEIPPVLDPSLLVDKTSEASGSEMASSGLTPSTGSLCLLATPGASEAGLNPFTPTEQCHSIPSGPPEMPRAVEIHRNLIRRWMPTPTEGVLPSLSYVTSTSSPSSASMENSSSSISNRSTDGITTERMETRPTRALSWLSMPKGVSTFRVNSLLASPIAPLLGSDETTTASP